VSGSSYQRQREQVHPADQNRGDRECARVERVRRLAEAQAQVLRHRAHLRPVVEGHHHQPEEHHRGDGADPVVMHGRHAVLGAVGRLAEDLQRAQVRRDEGQSSNPRR
jgi:hypothetical protein